MAKIDSEVVDLIKELGEVKADVAVLTEKVDNLEEEVRDNEIKFEGKVVILENKVGEWGEKKAVELGESKGERKGWWEARSGAVKTFLAIVGGVAAAILAWVIKGWVG